MAKTRSGKLRPDGPAPDRMAAMIRQRELAGQGPVGILAGGEKTVRIERLTEDPKNERKTFEGLEGLAASIRSTGLIESVVVTPIEGSDRLMILAGHRRYRAAKLAGLDMIRVRVETDVDDQQRRIKSVVSNVQREDVPPLEMAQGLQALMDDEGLNQAGVGEMIGKDKQWVSGMLRLLTLPTGVIEKVGSSRLSYDTMIRVARLDNAEDQGELINMMLDGATVREVRTEIARRKGQPAAPSLTRETGDPAGEGGTKPRMKLVAKASNAAVIIQALDHDELSIDRQIEALQDALRQAKRRRKDQLATTEAA